MHPTPSPNVIRFGLFEADLSARELRKRGRKIPLQDQPFRVLAVLLSRPGELVSREEFQRALWPGDTFVEFDEGLNKAMQKLRQALDDSSDNPRFIETLPRKGYRFIAPVDRSSAVTPVEKPTKRQDKKTLAWVLAGGVLLALAAMAVTYFGAFRPVFQPAQKTVPLTTYPGRQITPAFSPDGKQVAFAWDGEKGENLNIYVKLVDAGEPLRLTTNPAPESTPAWSPDGRYIAFYRAFADHYEIWMVPALGGAERKLGQVALPDYFTDGLSWSPDGKYLAVFDKSAPREPFSIYVLSVETGAKRKLTAPPAEYIGDWSPRFSPDGRTLAFVRNDSHRGELFTLPVTSDGHPGGEPRRLTLDDRQIFGIDWTGDGRRILYSSGEYGSTSMFSIASSGGTPERVAVPGENPTAISISRGGSRLIYERDAMDSNIWRVPGPNSLDKNGPPSRLIASTRADWEPRYSPDGTKIVFSSARSGSLEIWVCDSEGRHPIQLTAFNGPDVGSPSWSPDSRWIAFDSSKAGNWDIYVVSVNGGQPRRLTTGASNHVRPSWSRDGRWIYYGGNPAGDDQIWKVPAQDGAPVQVTKGGGGHAFESADGSFVYYHRGDSGIWRMPAAGGEETHVFDRVGTRFDKLTIWALTGQGICFLGSDGSASTVLNFYDFATGKVSAVRKFPKDSQDNWYDTPLAVSPDGLWILYSHLDQAGSNLMLVENLR